MPAPGGCLVRGGAWPGGVSAPRGVPAPGGAWWRPPSPRTATAAGGTHPTGMHPRFTLISNFTCMIKVENLKHAVSEE